MGMAQRSRFSSIVQAPIWQRAGRMLCALALLPFLLWGVGLSATAAPLKTAGQEVLSRADAEAVLLALTADLAEDFSEEPSGNLGDRSEVLLEPVPTEPAIPQTLPAVPVQPLRIQGSPSLAALNRALKQSYEALFPEASVQIEAGDTTEALEALLADDLELVALGRSLTPAEQALGLKEFSLPTEAVAFVVNSRNPFRDALTLAQVSDIFEGAITNWAQVGGIDQPIRVVEQRPTSETRLVLSQAGIIPAVPLVPSVMVEANNPAALTRSLGRDGIGYGIASQLAQQTALRPVPLQVLQDTLPSLATYPYDLTRRLAYQDSNLTIDTRAFLGFLTHAGGQRAIALAQQTESLLPASADPQIPVNPDPNAATSDFPQREPADAMESVDPRAEPQTVTQVPGGLKDQPAASLSPWLLLLGVPLLAIPGVLWLRKGRSPSSPSLDTPESTDLAKDFAIASPPDADLSDPPELDSRSALKSSLPSTTQATRPAVPDPWENAAAPSDRAEPDPIADQEVYANSIASSPEHPVADSPGDSSEDSSEDSLEILDFSEGEVVAESLGVLESLDVSAGDSEVGALDEPGDSVALGEFDQDTFDQDSAESTPATMAAAIAPDASYTELIPPATQDSAPENSETEDLETEDLAPSAEVSPALALDVPDPRLAEQAAALAIAQQELEAVRRALTAQTEGMAAAQQAAIAPLQQALGQAQAETARLTVQASSLQTELERLQAEAAAAAQRWAERDAEAATAAVTLQQQLSAEQADQDRAIAEIARLTQSIQESETGALLAALEYAEAEKMRLMTELDGVRSHLEQASFQQTAAELELAGMQESVAEVRSQAEQDQAVLQQRLEDLQLSHATAETQITTFLAQIATLTAASEEWQATQNRSQMDLEAAETTGQSQQERIAELETERDLMTAQIATISAEIETAKVGLERLQALVEEAEGDRQHLRQLHEAQQQQITELEAERHSLATQSEELSTELESQGTAAAAMLARTQAELQAAQAARHQIQQDSIDLRQHLEAVRLEKVAAETESRALRERLGGLEADYTHAQESLNRLYGQVATLQAETDTREAELNDLHAQMGVISTELAEREAAQDHLNRMLDDAQTAKTDQEAEVVALSADRDALHRRLETLQQERDRHAQAAIAQGTTLEALQTQLAAAQSEKATLEMAIASLQGSWDQTQTTLTRLESERITLRSSLEALQAEMAIAKAEAAAQFATAQAQVQGLEAEKAHLEAALSQATSTPSKGSTATGARKKSRPPAQANSFQAIPGIGSAYEQRLYAAGILTFADLANQSPDRLREIVSPNARRTIDTDSWIMEARDRQPDP